MKKIYIKPTVKAINMLPVKPLALSGEQTGVKLGDRRIQLSRETEGFDWDDEEEDSMWK